MNRHLLMPQQINLMMYGEGLSVENAAEKVIAVNKHVKIIAEQK